MALLASERAYEALNRKTKEVLGEKKAHQIKDEIAKEHVEKSGVINQFNLDTAPRSGTGQLHAFVDDYSQMLFWSTPDYIALVVKNLNEMMHEQPPRGDEYDYYDKRVGVPYSEWLKALNFSPKVISARAFKNFGWNRGFSPKGEDDDPIKYYTTTMEYEPGFAVTVIKWEKDPTDMELGRLLKSNGM